MSDLSRSTPKQEVPSREQIAHRAYEIYVNRGRGHGKDLEDWLAAESELRNQNAPRTLTSSSSSNSSNERARTSFSSSRQRQSKAKTPSPSSFENTNPVDHHSSSKEF